VATLVAVAATAAGLLVGASLLRTPLLPAVLGVVVRAGSGSVAGGGLRVVGGRVAVAVAGGTRGSGLLGCLGAHQWLGVSGRRDGVDEVALAHRRGALDAEAGRHRLELDQLHAGERGAGFGHGCPSREFTR